MQTPTPPPSHDLKHVADDLFRRMDYSSGPINTDDVKEKHKEHEKKAFADAFVGFFQKLAMGMPPPLPAAARKGIGSAVKSLAKPGAAAAVAGAGTGFKNAPALNPFKMAEAVYRPAKLNKLEKLIERAEPYGKAMGAAGMAASAGYIAHHAYKAHKEKKAHLPLSSFFDELIEKYGADLTPEARAKLPSRDFAVKAKKSNTGHEAYPMPDAAHARAALGFSKMHGDDADIAAVRKKVEQRFPGMIRD